MATENFTTYAEGGQNPGRLDQTADKSSFTALDRDDEAWLSDDKDAGHFSGDFEHLLEIEQISTDAFSLVGYWVLANVLEDIRALTVNDRDFLACEIYNDNLRMREINAGESTVGDVQYGITDTQEEFLKIKRTEGSPSHLFCYVYDSFARDSLRGGNSTIDVTLTEDQNFQYILVPVSYDDSAGGQTATGYINQLDLQEEAPPEGRIMSSLVGGGGLAGMGGIAGQGGGLGG